jgi:hypothetical protein
MIKGLQAYGRSQEVGRRRTVHLFLEERHYAGGRHNPPYRGRSHRNQKAGTGGIVVHMRLAWFTAVAIQFIVVVMIRLLEMMMAMMMVIMVTIDMRVHQR